MCRWIFGTCALFLASVAVAQQPIVAVKVMPENDALKGSAWNKPIVVNSRDSAAKYFGKAELDKLAKEVDFQKQFVLVFAWQGSGGDKLNFAIAESFPEQIFFTLKPGVTDDIASHLHVYALRSNVRWSIRGDAKKGAAAKLTVRPIPFNNGDSGFAYRTRTSNPVTLTDAKAVESLVGKAAAKALIGAVDFTRDALVLVYWTNEGTGGRLTYELKGDAADPTVTFFVRQSKVDGIQRQRPNLEADFFAIPRGAKVKFDPSER